MLFVCPLRSGADGAPRGGRKLHCASTLGEHWWRCVWRELQLPPSSPGGADGGDAISDEVFGPLTDGLERVWRADSSRLETVTSPPFATRSSGAVLAVAATAVAWGMVGVLVRWVSLPAVVIVAGRTAIGTLLLAPFVVTRRRVRLGWWAVVVGPLLALHWLALVLAQQRAPIGTVLLITYLAPVMVAVLAGRVLHERVPGAVVVALALAVVGIWVLADPRGHAGSGELLALGAAVTYAALVLVTKRIGGHVDAITISFVELAGAAIVLVPFAAVADWGPARSSWWWLVVLGSVFTAGLVTLFVVLLRRLPATTVGVLTYLEPASAVMFGWIFLDEVPGASTVVGGMLILVAGVIVVFATARAQGAIASVPR